MTKAAEQFEYSWINDLYAERDRLKVDNAALAGALERFLKEYIELVESGDAGFWDVEEEEKIIHTRAVLKAHGPAPEGGSET